jgi:predicted GIY-YIG superfamily endonuclease
VALTVKGVRGLLARGEVGKHFDKFGLYLVIDSPTSARWLRRYQFNKTPRHYGIGPVKAYDLEQARERNRRLSQLIADGIDPLQQRRAEQAESAQDQARSLHQHVVRKYKQFQEEGKTPQAYLYRHFEPDGDLLYVGVSLSPLQRSQTHTESAAWREHICLIVIEPFATREEALAAEETAIRDEYPKYNRTHNGHRHPLAELKRLRRRAMRAEGDELMQIKRDYKKISQGRVIFPA